MSDLIAFDPPEPDELSNLLDGYDVSSLIATGGMGAVYAANQISLDRPVAIKLLPRELGNESFREQFQAEARSMAKLNHPNLIGIYDFGQADGMPYIVMELVEGKSLYYSCYKTAVDQQTACELIIEICEGLAHAHKAGIIHRDIKPANILLDPDAHAKIGDFGLASQTDSDGEHMAFGTPGYAAPEILENPGAIGIPSDIFAVGVILYELLTGFIPEQPPRPASTIHKSDPRLDTIIRTATRRNPRMRYQNAQDMADEIKQLLPHLGKTSGGGHGGGANPKLKLGSSAPSKGAKLTRSKGTGKETTGVKLTTAKASGAKLETAKVAGIKRETSKVTSAKLTPLPRKNSEEEEEDDPKVVPAPQVVPMADSGNWPIIRNLMIIALLIPAIIFAIGKYKDKQERIAIEEEKDRKERQAKSDKANAERNAAKAAAEKKAAADKLAKEQAKALAEQHAHGVHNPSVTRTPLQQLEYLRPDLANGRREKFPEGAIERGNSFLFLVETPMSWSQAAQFAEDHGAHLATPETAADVDALASNIGDRKRAWIGGGALGRTDWGWVTGQKWNHAKPSTTLGSCAALSPSGLIKARPNGEKNAFVIQWSKSGRNKGTLAAQLTRLQGTLGSPSPAWPPGTVVQQNRHYLLVHRSLTWDEADLASSSGKGHLAVATDGLEMNFIRDTLSSALGIDESAWLGGRRNNDWYWVTGEPWKQANWQPNAPGDGANATALHFTNSKVDPGWMNSSPDSQEVEAFLIEWSNDASDFEKSGKDNPNPNAGDNATAREKINAWRGIIRKSLVKKTENHTKILKDNIKYVGGSMRQWLNIAPGSQQQRFGARIQTMLNKMDEDGEISEDRKFRDNLPAEIQKHLVRGLETQKRQREKFSSEVTTLRNSYLNRLLGELDRLKNAGLNSQAAMIQAEIDGMGQTSDAFRAHLTN